MNGTKAASLASRLDALPLNRWHGVLMTVCCLGLLFDCYDMMIIGVVLPKLIAAWKITPVHAGMLASAGFAGMAIGGILFGVMADAIGRWKVFQLTLLVYAVLTGACALANGFTSMIILRIAVGLGLGGLVPVDSAYLAEYVPSKYRGRFMGWFAAFSPIGNAMAFIVGFLVVVPIGWRWGFVLGIIPAVFLMFIRRTLPESVRYLVQKGRITEGVKIVEGLEQRVLGRTTVPHEEAVEREKLATAKSKEAKVRIRDLFTGGRARSTIMICVLWFSVNYVLYGLLMWMPTLLMKELHIALGKGFIFLMMAQLIGTIGQFSAGFNMDFIGRRPTIIYSFICMGLTPYFLFWLGKDPTIGSILLIVLSIFNSSSFGTIYAYTPENFPTTVRGTGVGFAGFIGRAGGMLGPTVLGLVYAKAGLSWVLNINMTLLLASLVVLLTLGRETRGKTLEQISAEQTVLATVPAAASR